MMQAVILTTGPDISEGSIFLTCSSPPFSVIDLVRFTEELGGRGGALDFLFPSFPRKLLRLAALGNSIFSAGAKSASSFFSSFNSVKQKKFKAWI